MELASQATIAQGYEDFHKQFAPFFQRSETRQRVSQYIRGLLAAVKRKNCWQLAETLGAKDPQGFQRLLYEAQWDEDAVGGRLMALTSARIGHPQGIGIVDESGFVKKGTKSVGVKRQYCGRVGKVENCQVGVFVGYVTPKGRALLDRALYLPRNWCDDHPRRAAAKIPETILFQTKPELARQLLAKAWQAGVAMQWVTGDTTYGNAASLRHFIHRQGRWYVLGVTASRRATQVGTSTPLKVRQIAARLPETVWQRWATGYGEQGLAPDDWAAVRVTLADDVVAEQWLLIRRSLSEPTAYKYFLSNAPPTTALVTLTEVALARHHIEQLLEEAKSHAGLADYEVRHWPSWQRHMTLALMAHTWLTLFQEPVVREKN